MKQKSANQSAVSQSGNTAVNSSAKLPPLPTYQSVGGAALQKTPPLDVKQKKRKSKSNKASSVRRRASKAPKQTDLAAQVDELQGQLAALRAAVEGRETSVESQERVERPRSRASANAQPTLTSSPEESSGYSTGPSYSPLQHAVDARREGGSPPSTLDSGPSTLDPRLPSTPLDALSEQIAELRTQLSTLVARSSSPVTGGPPLHHPVVAQREGGSPPSTLDSGPSTRAGAKPMPIYELKETHPVGYQSSDLSDSSSEESKDGFFSGLFDYARIQWLAGDWEGLAKLAPAKFSDHRDRANVALITALGRVQLGDVPGSKECFKLAKKWGVDRRLAISFIYQGALSSLKSARQLKNLPLPANKPAAKRIQLPTQRVFVPFDEDKNRERWKGTSNLKEDWNSRTISLAKMIPAHSKVLEFGAGNCILKNHLPPGCEYTPSDLYDRGNGTLVMDLNGEDFQIPEGFDCCVLSGVLEYIIDVSRFVKEASKKVPHMIFSYAIYERNKDIHGDWVNHYAFNEILEIFEEQGYDCIKMKNWKRQMLFHFQR